MILQIYKDVWKKFIYFLKKLFLMFQALDKEFFEQRNFTINLIIIEYYILLDNHLKLCDVFS
jgi:hypothetical protein